MLNQLRKLPAFHFTAQGQLHDSIKYNSTVGHLDTVETERGALARVSVGESTHVFDWCINCTYNQISRVTSLCYFEVCLTLVYEQVKPTKEIVGITIMDGDFCSLYPYILDEDDFNSGRRRYTLTHVKHTPLFKSDDYLKASNFMESIKRADVESKVPHFENGFKHFYPSFKSEFKFVDWFVSMKTKPLDQGAANHTASRECLAEIDGRIVSILSGKINTLFEAERHVLETLLQSWSEQNRVVPN